MGKKATNKVTVSIIDINEEGITTKMVKTFQKKAKKANLAVFTLDVELTDDKDAAFEGNYVLSCAPESTNKSLKKAAKAAVSEDVGDDYTITEVTLKNTFMPKEAEEEETPKPKKTAKKAKKAPKKAAKADDSDDDAETPKKGKKGKKGKKAKADKTPKITMSDVLKSLKGAVKASDGPIEAYNLVLVTERWSEAFGFEVVDTLRDKVTMSEAYAKLLRKVCTATLADIVSAVSGLKGKTPSKKVGAAFYELLDRVYVGMQNEDVDVDLDELIESLNETAVFEPADDSDDDDSDDDDSDDDDSDDDDDDDSDDDDDDDSDDDDDDLDDDDD